MKKLNKICLKQRYWGYCFRCNKENKLQELILGAYPVSFEKMTDDLWALGLRKKNYEE
ncbi:MAG: hypothetical protein OHM56_03900 [Spiroplasma phoeniceum]|nr:MAG: hypothetical protein OHM57_03365 [Spiroplasma phoeniceum]UZQ33096.1 MAG: hypothetical protein OHM56_03900 [Spiroplasma phoeniceum]